FGPPCIFHTCSFCWLNCCLRLLLLQGRRKPKPLSVGGRSMTVLAPRQPIRRVTAIPPPWSTASAGSPAESATPFLPMRQISSTSAFPRLTSAALRQSLSHFGQTGPTRQAGDMRCLRPPGITPIPLRGSASFRTIIPAQAFRPPYVATSGTWLTAIANPLPEYGTIWRWFLTKARQEGKK